MTRISPHRAGAAALASVFRFVFSLLVTCVALLSPTHVHAQCDARLQCCATPRAGGAPGSCDADAPAEVR
jgi:hypothetical protein